MFAEIIFLCIGVIKGAEQDNSNDEALEQQDTMGTDELEGTFVHEVFTKSGHEKKQRLRTGRAIATCARYM